MFALLKLCRSEYDFYQEIIPEGFVRLHDCHDDCAVLFLLIELEDVYDTLKTLFITTWWAILLYWNTKFSRKYTT